MCVGWEYIKERAPGLVKEIDNRMITSELSSCYSESLSKLIFKVDLWFCVLDK